MTGRRVNGIAHIEIVDDPLECRRSPAAKPFLRATFEDGQVVEMSTNLAEMIGGAGKGARERWELLTRSPPAGRG